MKTQPALSKQAPQMPSKAERRRSVVEEAKVDIDKKQLTYEGLDEAESCSNGAGSLDPVKADDHVVPGGEPELVESSVCVSS